MPGVILINKPLHYSSFKIVKRVKAITNTKKVGHGGTLDPLATGMLPVFLGEASKFARFILEADKCYSVKADIGTLTTTGDMEGKVLSSQHNYQLSEADILQHINKFSGDILQTPPSYSALKHNGKPLYEYARQGIDIVKPPRLVNIKKFEIISWKKPILECKVVCSKGTYIRTLLEDLGKSLGAGAALTALHRNWVSPFIDASMLELEELDDFQSSPAYYSLGKMFEGLQRMDLSEQEALDLCYGKRNTVDFNDEKVACDACVALFYNGFFLGIATKINFHELRIMKLQSSMVKELTKC